MNFIPKGNDLALIWYQVCCSIMNRNWDMINLLPTSSWEVSAILFFGCHLENGRIWSGHESFLNVCHVKNIWCKCFACIIKWSISLNLLPKQLHYNVNTDSQWSKHEACFARATHVWLAVDHNTSVTSGEWIRCSKCIARASELGSCQSKLWHSWGYERLQKSKDSLKAGFENVNIVE